MSIRLVCLDAGFTLIRPVETMADRLARVLTEHGHDADEEEIRQAWDAADAWFWDAYHTPGNETWTSDERIEATWRSYHRLMLERLGYADEDRDILEAVLVAQTATEAWEPYEDTRPALEDLRSTRREDPGGRVRLAVVSDWGSVLTDLLDGLGLSVYFDAVLASGAEGVAKPSADFFRLACRRTGVDPAHAVMIGDSYRADVLGARAAGMSAILLDRAGTAEGVDPDVAVVRTLTDAVATLRSAAEPRAARVTSAERS